jgi:hypothetical protein
MVRRQVFLLIQKYSIMSASQSIRDQMYSLIEEWKHGGGSQKTFCSKHSITVLKFQYWHKRYKAEKFPAPGNQPSFIEMKLPVSEIQSRCGGQAEVIFANGTRMLFHGEVSAHFLKSLV